MYLNLTRLCLLALLVWGSGCRQRLPNQPSPPDGSTHVPVRQLYPSGPGSFVQIIEKLRPSVVHLSAGEPVPRGVSSWFPMSAGPVGEQHGELQQRAHHALGSGFIINREGLILTTARVAAQGQTILVHLPGGARLPATLTGHDLPSNTALLKITPPAEAPLIPARLGQSQDLRVGEKVAALGNPFGLDITASVGVIHAKEAQDLPTDQIGHWGLLQTDAAIHPGNSGGPLINAFGEVVGINAALEQDTRGIGFAVPLELARKILPMLQREGKVVRTYLGVYIKLVTGEIAERVGLAPARGAYADAVLPGGPAERAGLRAGDVILTFDGKKIKQASTLKQLADFAGVDREIPITVWRDGEALNFGLTPERKPD